MDFAVLCSRLLARLRRLVESGAIKESALARRLGISQSHLNNTLKGVRGLPLGMADQFLSSMHWAVLDLCDDEEIRREFTRRRAPNVKGREFPVRSLRDLGSDVPSRPDQRRTIPRALLAGLAEPALFIVDRDTDTGGLAAAGDILLVDLACPELLSESLYILLLDGKYVLRWVRKGARWIYLIRLENCQDPMGWTRLDTVSAAARIHRVGKRHSGEFLPPQAPLHPASK